MVNEITNNTELCVLVASEYLERRDDDGDIVESAVRHWPFHGPASRESCKAVKDFMENEPGYTWGIFFHIATVAEYNAGVFE